MQRRLLISMLAVAVAAVLLLGIPLGFVLGRLQVNEATQQLRHDADDARHRAAGTGSDAGLPPDAAELGQVAVRPLRDHPADGRRPAPRSGTSRPAHDTITGRGSTRPTSRSPSRPTIRWSPAR